ncbi:hypothetical protein TNCV_1612981 [Trichonephila clavipes]|nr:hypothetical protein TNCV_1612981 [Trichonephila clavipes]
MDKGSMVADSFRSEKECCAELALVWKQAKEGKGNYYEVDGYLFRRDKNTSGRVLGSCTLGWGEARPVTSLSAKRTLTRTIIKTLTVAIIVCSVCGFSVSRVVNFLFLVNDMVKISHKGQIYLRWGVYEPLPAPGNRSNERRYREEDLATTGEKGRNGGTRERVTKKPGS